MDGEYVRLCPSCGRENPPNAMRCSCAAMLLGVDTVRKTALAEFIATPQSATDPTAGARMLRCRFEDCGQPNSPDAVLCAYCNRSLTPPSESTLAGAPGELLRLPRGLATAYRIVRNMPTRGAEADLLLVEPLAGGVPMVAKIFRPGIEPNPGVQERLKALDSRHVIRIVASGASDGRSYEVMDYCQFGSLRDLFRKGPVPVRQVTSIVGELAQALAAIHAIALVHRDLKPENVLIRLQDPFELVLIDFATASVLEATQRFTGMARTLAYAAPESLSGVIDVKADYWALGMMLLEAVLGEHPFSGLSEAVILHHLATRSIDLQGVSNDNLRKLIRGLLLRDPQTRWSEKEVARWMRNDPSLAEPADSRWGARFAQAYHLGETVCETPEQLGVALASHWAEGAADLRNGQLLAWFRDVQKDQNTVRLLLADEHDAKLHVDVRLVRLIVRLAPGIPPVWRGESVELAGLLVKTSQALKGDADAAHWVASIYAFGVLDVYATSGNEEAAQLSGVWRSAIERFESAWETALIVLRANGTSRDPERVVIFDEVMYGKSGPEHPTLLWEHPRLLALSYDPGWLAHLRGRLAKEFSEVAIASPWIVQLGDPVKLEAPELLVLEALLPDVRKAAESEAKTRTVRQETQVQECTAMVEEIWLIVERAHAASSRRALPASRCANLRSDLDRFFELLARLLVAQAGEPSFLETRRILKRLEPIASRMIAELDVLSERREANTGWTDQRVLGFAAAVALLTPLFLGERALLAVVGVLFVIVIWRLAPTYFAVQKIRGLATHFRREGAGPPHRR